MTTYLVIPDSDIDPESPIDTSLETRYRDNLIASFEGDPIAPKLTYAALAFDMQQLILAAATLRFSVNFLRTGAVEAMERDETQGRDSWRPFTLLSEPGLGAASLVTFSFSGEVIADVAISYNYAFIPPDDTAQIRLLRDGAAVATSGDLLQGNHELIFAGVPSSPSATDFAFEGWIGSGSGTDTITITDVRVTFPGS
jgi:hypothetical protein